MFRSVLVFVSVAALSASFGCSKDPGTDDDADADGSGGSEDGGEGGFGGVDASGGSGGEPDPGPAVCPEATEVYEVQPAQTNLLFLLDRSGSMHLRVTDLDTRWTLTTAGLAQIVQALPSETVAGLQMFPSGDDPVTCCVVTAGNFIDCGACAEGDLPGPEARCEEATYDPLAVEMAALSQAHADEIVAAVKTSDEEFYWGTPLAPALGGAISGVSGLDMEGVTSVVLLSDGLPTSCHTDADPEANAIQRALDAAGFGAQNGVRTYVVGIDAEAASSDPASDLAINLSLVAQAGGTARYAGCEQTNDCAYRVNVDNFEAALSEALSDIALEATSCSLDLPEVEGGSPDLDAVNITIESDGQTVTIPKDASHADGWDYLPGNQQVQLYGGACELLKNDATATIVVVVGCKTEEV